MPLEIIPMLSLLERYSSDYPSFREVSARGGITSRTTRKGMVTWTGLPGRNKNGERISLGWPILEGVTDPDSLIKHLIENEATGYLKVIRNNDEPTEVLIEKGEIIFRGPPLS